MKRHNIFSYCLLFSMFTIFNLQALAQPITEKTAADLEELNNLRKEIEKNPADLDLHDKYLKASGFTKWGVDEDPEFIKLYEDWIVKYPTTAAIPYALGHAFAGKESPKAKPYLLKAVAIDPKFHKAYFDLWIDGERWGDFKAASDYLLKAKEIAPDNADYAFYYASGMKVVDPPKYKELSLAVAKNFPNTERGAQALYWLANKSQNPAEKIKLYEQQKKDFPANKFNWTSSGMSEYFALLIEESPNDALKLANEMEAASQEERSKKTWIANIELVKKIIEVKKMLSDNKAMDASAILDSVKVPRWGSSKDYIILLKAEALYKAGKKEEAYNNLLKTVAKEPSTRFRKELLKYGTGLGKKEAEINNQVWYVRDTSAKVAPIFNLDNYLTTGKSSLNDFKGKVVLITYWFPGCGPCRGEFPHFENVVKKFKGNDFVYLGINITPDQDAYVVPFMKSSGYSFIPLRDNKDWVKGPLDNRNAAPMNFLIDENGKIIFSDFRTDASNEATLDMMISSMLERKKPA
ncbi:MAG: redoxin family protein [Chitinophagaceae bacterium]